MGSVLVTEAGRSDQEGVIAVTYSPEQNLNQHAAPSPDLTEYEAYPDRCRQMKLDGTRCGGKAIPSKQNLCMVHATKTKEPDETK